MNLSRLSLTIFIALAIGGALSLLISSSTVLSLFTQAIIYALFASGVGVLLRQNGMVSFGHALYFGGTGYGIGILLQSTGSKWRSGVTCRGAGGCIGNGEIGVLEAFEECLGFFFGGETLW